MSERIGIVETALGDIHLTELVGPAHLGEDRKLLQVGDNLQLNKDDAVAMAHALLAWKIGEPVPDYEREGGSE